MKKNLLVFLALLSLAAAAQAKNMSAALTVSYLGKADSGFKEIYGSGGIQPGLRLEALLGKGISLYGSYDYFSKKGKTPVLQEDASSRQHFISAGAAWRKGLSEKLDWSLYGGLLLISYQEEALGETVKENAFGVELGGSLQYKMSSRLFLFPFVSYMIANDSVGEVEVKLGGFKVGVGLGIKF
ncbi:MAG: hypothetical protein E4H23_08180 [Chrysiogenales bacterium]|nr:MAG: hypothetical protein E4H23_08180 [Chrysiogenales bacterium]